LRARPEQTQLEDLSEASILGKLLVLPANVRLDWKVIARYKHSCLFGLVVSNEEKKFYNIDTRIDLLSKVEEIGLFPMLWVDENADIDEVSFKGRGGRVGQ